MLNKRGRILLYGSAIWYFGDGLLGPLFAVFSQNVGGNVLDVTNAWAAYLVVTGICTVIVGRVADHFAKRNGRELLMIAGYALNTVLTFAYLTVDTPSELFWIQVGLGLSVALAAPTWLALFSHSTLHEKSSSAWSTESALQKTVEALAIFIGGYIVTHYSFEMLFIIMGSVQAIATIYQARILWAPRN